MKKTFQYPNSLLNLADENLKRGNKNKALAICDNFFRLFSDKKNMYFFPYFMDLGNTPFSNYNYFIRYKPFRYDPSFVFLKKACLRDDYRKFSEEIKNFLKFHESGNDYFLFLANFVLGNFDKSFVFLNKYLISEKDIIIDDIFFPLRHFNRSIFEHVKKMFFEKKPKGDWGKIYYFYFLYKEGKNAELLTNFNPPDKIPLSFYLKGKFLLDSCIPEEALRSFKKTLRFYPEILEPRGFAAECLLLTGKDEKAFRMLDKKNLKDNLENSRKSWLASLYLFAGRFKEAEEILKECPKDPLVLCWMGAVLSSRGFHKKALKFLDSAISYRKADVEAKLWLTHCLLSLGLKKEAFSNAESILKEEENKIWPSVYCYICSKQKEKKAAEIKLKKEIIKTCESLKFISGGKVKLKLKKKFDAEKFCKAMIEKNKGLRRCDNYWIRYALIKTGFFK
ncbi:MAG: hypothetical protein GX447_00400 [Elusimicrobia bacterium]|nr:hypothetical protein [Elusimicrobiota bacterium]